MSSAKPENIWDAASEKACRQAVTWTINEYGEDAYKYKTMVDKICASEWDKAYKLLGTLAKKLGEDAVVFRGKIKDKLDYLIQKESKEFRNEDLPTLEEFQRLAGIVQERSEDLPATERSEVSLRGMEPLRQFRMRSFGFPSVEHAVKKILKNSPCD